MLYTDGLTDAMSPAGKALGRDRVRSLLQGAKSQSLSDLMARVMEQLEAHRGSTAQSDDVTVLAIEF